MKSKKNPHTYIDDTSEGAWWNKRGSPPGYPTSNPREKKSKEQIRQEEEVYYQSLDNDAKKALDKLGFNFEYIGNKIAILDAMVKGKKWGHLGIALGNKGVRDKFQERFPGVNSVPEAIVALRQYFKDWKSEHAHVNPRKRKHQSASNPRQPASASAYKKTKWFIGTNKHGSGRTVFSSGTQPTSKVYGKQFASVMGPYASERAAVRGMGK